MRFALSVVLALTISMTVGAEQSAPVGSKVSDALARMKSTDLSARERGFDELMALLAEENSAPASGAASGFAKFFARHPDQADAVKLGLIQLLASSNGLFVAGKNAALEEYTEDDGEHYAQLIDAVSSLDDGRAIPALVGAMTTGGMAQRGLVKYGDKALGPVMQQLNNRDPLVRAAALGLSITLLNKQNDPTSHKRAVDLLRSALTDSSSVVRSHAIREIGCLAERQDFVPILEKTSKDDPEKFARKAPDGSDAADFYPVRHDAQRVLRDIQDSKSCAP